MSKIRYIYYGAIRRTRRSLAAFVSCYIGNINLKKRTKNIHKMGASAFKENAGTQKDTFKMWRKLFI